MKYVLLGDIGWQYLYHLGDEAMTEAAIDQLNDRGAEKVTLIAAQVHVAENFYGQPAVKRFGFSSKWSRETLESQLDAETLRMMTGVSPLHDAVREADAVIIAGGGNMNSDHAYHLYERVALKRLAEAHGKALFVTSQTIGPMLRPRDKELVAEIISYAECFGARESESYKLALALGGTDGRVSQTMDDAMMLRAHTSDYEVVRRLGLSERYIVASFTSHQGSTGLTEDQYTSRIAETLDILALQFDADIALAPHTGSLDVSVRKGDQLLNYSVAKKSKSGRLKPLDMLTARQVVALTEGAILSASTRYHPTVFGPAAKVPTASISLSYYSSVRMRGSMENVGLKGYVIPATSWNTAAPALAELIERTSEFSAHISKIADKRRTSQSEWWDAIVATASGAHWPELAKLEEVPELKPYGSWSTEVEHVTPVFELYGREKVWSKWFAEDRKATDELLKAATKEKESAEQALAQVKLQNSRSWARIVPAIRRRLARGAQAANTVFRRSIRR